MAFIWTDKRQNNENVGLAPTTNLKQFSSARKHSVKKQAFGELKNVIHNQGAATPFKGAVNKWSAAENVHSTGFGPTKTLCSDVLREQQIKQNFTDAQKLLEKKLNLSTPTPAARANVKFSSALKTTIYEDLDDDFELPVNTCTGECTKSLEEIWGAMNMVDEEFLNKVINGGDPDSDTEDADKNQLKWSNDDDLVEEDISESMPLYNWNIPEEIKMPKLPDYEFEIPQLQETCF